MALGEFNSSKEIYVYIPTHVGNKRMHACKCMDYKDLLIGRFSSLKATGAVTD